MTEAIPTNLRTIRILEVVSRAGEPLTPTRINAELGLAKQTVHRLCQTLVEQGYLSREGHDSRLRPGRRLRDMAVGALHTSHFHIARHQILRHVAVTVGETVNFVVPADAGMTYRDRIETDWALRIQLPIGSHVPFHCTASGKTFLASLPARERVRFVRALTLERSTPSTLSDHDALLAELEQIRAQGYAIDNEEFMEGMIAVAVPVLDHSGRYVASIAFHAPRQRLTLDAAVANKGVLLTAAEKLRDSCL